jgi:alpha-L-fucosidase 2
MLVQSHEDGIELLPALPNEWDSGRFKGVCTRGAFELDMIWKNNAIKSVEVLSKAGKNCKIRTNKKPRIFTDGKQIQIKENNGFIEFPTEKGKIYILEY